MFTKEERVEFLRATAGLGNVKVEYYDGLLADYTKLKGASVIVKGLRALSDFEYEFQMALTNRKINPKVETVFLTTTAEYMYSLQALSSRWHGSEGMFRFCSRMYYR